MCCRRFGLLELGALGLGLLGLGALGLGLLGLGLVRFFCLRFGAFVHVVLLDRVVGQPLARALLVPANALFLGSSDRRHLPCSEPDATHDGQEA